MERAEADTGVPQESGKIDERESDKEKPMTVSPNASPGKTVRIKENGAKANGDTEVKSCLWFSFIFLTKILTFLGFVHILDSFVVLCLF